MPSSQYHRDTKYNDGCQRLGVRENEIIGFLGNRVSVLLIKVLEVGCTTMNALNTNELKPPPLKDS